MRALRFVLAGVGGTVAGFASGFVVALIAGSTIDAAWWYLEIGALLGLLVGIALARSSMKKSTSGRTPERAG